MGGDDRLSSRTNEDRLSYRSSLEKEELLPTSACSSSATSSSRSSLERDGEDEEEARSLSPASLCSQDREWSYSVSYISSSHNNEDDAESCYFSYPGPSPGPSSPLPSPILGLRRQGSTSILLERNQETGDITSIVRLDSQQPPAILYSKRLDSEMVAENAEYVEESEVTYHNYTAVEKREEGCQTEVERVVMRVEGETQTNLVVRKEESAQTEEEVEVKEIRKRRESRELALSLAQQELADVVGKLEAAQERGAEQVDEGKFISPSPYLFSSSLLRS